MSMQDDNFASEPTHHTAMSVRELMLSVVEVYFADRSTFSEQDISDLELSHSQLGTLLRAVRKPS